MRRTLGSLEAEVLEGGSLTQLEQSLRLPSLLVAETALLVLSVRLATTSAFSLRALARDRAHRRLRPGQVILIYEFGTLATIAAPDLAPCITVAIFEKPFDLQALHAIAVASLNERAGTTLAASRALSLRE